MAVRLARRSSQRPTSSLQVCDTYTVGPKWKGGQDGEKELLESCYRESLRIALNNNCESVAFPLISSGVYGYPKDQALKIVVDTITSFLIDHDILVYIVIFDKSAFQISEKLFLDIASYIDDKSPVATEIFNPESLLSITLCDGKEENFDDPRLKLLSISLSLTQGEEKKEN